MRISDWSSDVCSSDLDMVELRIAHMGVDLRRVADAAGGQPEAIDRPVEIMLPIALPERHPLAHRGLIDLDRLGAGGFAIDHLFPDRSPVLAARSPARRIRSEIRTDEAKSVRTGSSSS